MPVLGDVKVIPEHLLATRREARRGLAADSAGSPPNRGRGPLRRPSRSDDAALASLRRSSAPFSCSRAARRRRRPVRGDARTRRDVRACRRAAEPRPAHRAARDDLPDELRARAVRALAAAAERDPEHRRQREARRRRLRCGVFSHEPLRPALRRGLLGVHARLRRASRSARTSPGAPGSFGTPRQIMFAVAPLDRPPREHPHRRHSPSSASAISPNEAFLGYAGAVLWSQQFGTRRRPSRSTAPACLQPKKPVVKHKPAPRKKQREAARIASRGTQTATPTPTASATRVLGVEDVELRGGRTRRRAPRRCRARPRRARLRAARGSRRSTPIHAAMIAEVP